MAEQARGRLILIVLGLVFAAPVLISSFLFYFTNVGRDASAAHGTLINPPVTLPDVGLNDTSGAPGTGRLYGKWSLIYALSGPCDQNCEEYLFAMRQLRDAQGNNAHRVQRVLAVYGAPGQALTPEQAVAWPGQLLLDTALLGTALKPGLLAPEAGLYLCDPLGNLMMHYAPGTPPEGIVRDLKRLLRYSRIG